jgi:NAD(P)H dehydrogenase (quinone)
MTLFSIIASCLRFGMVVVGLDSGCVGQRTLDGITDGAPDGAATIAGGGGSCLPTADEFQGARCQDREIAATASKLHG